MFGQLLPNKNKQVTVATVRGKFGRRQLGAQLNKAKEWESRGSGRAPHDKDGAREQRGQDG